MKKEYYVQPYEYNAFADAVISRHPDYEAWNANNYIQTFVTKRNNDQKDIYIDYYSGSVFGLIPLLKINDLSPSKLLDPEQVYDRIKQGIKQGQVYYAYLDHFYFPFSQEYQTNHDAHDVLVTSYDENNYSYVENIRGAYHQYNIDENRFKESFINCKNNCIFELEADLNNHYMFDIDVFKQMLFEYVNSIKPVDDSIYFHENGFYSSNHFETKKALTVGYGIDCYAWLAEDIEKKVSQKQMVDYRIFYFLREHKHNMIDKIEYLKQHNYLDIDNYDKLVQQFKNIEHRLNLIMCKVVKYDFQFVASVVDGVAEEMVRVAEDDKRACNDLLVSLS